jgi:hypothetical protein
VTSSSSAERICAHLMVERATRATKAMQRCSGADPWTVRERRGDRAQRIRDDDPRHCVVVERSQKRTRLHLENLVQGKSRAWSARADETGAEGGGGRKAESRGPGARDKQRGAGAGT